MLDTIRWRILLVALAGLVNRRPLEVIAYLREENRVLKEHLGGQRLHFTDPESPSLTPQKVTRVMSSRCFSSTRKASA